MIDLKIDLQCKQYKHMHSPMSTGDGNASLPYLMDFDLLIYASSFHRYFTASIVFI